MLKRLITLLLITVVLITPFGQTANAANSTVTFSKPTDSKYKSKAFSSDTNACFVLKINKSAGIIIDYLGVYIWEDTGNLCSIVAEGFFPVGNVKASTTTFHAWYNIQDELKVTLRPGVTYYYSITAFYGSKTSTSGTYSFTTTGKTVEEEITDAERDDADSIKSSMKDFIDSVSAAIDADLKTAAGKSKDDEKKRVFVESKIGYNSYKKGAIPNLSCAWLTSQKVKYFNLLDSPSTGNGNEWVRKNKAMAEKAGAVVVTGEEAYSAFKNLLSKDGVNKNIVISLTNSNPAGHVLFINAIADKTVLYTEHHTSTSSGLYYKAIKQANSADFLKSYPNIVGYIDFPD